MTRVTLIPADTGAHRYWRLYITSSAGPNPYPGFSEIELRSSAGGADLTGSGTASASATEGGRTPADAVDNSTTTYWATYPTSPPVWWAYDFGSGVAHDIVELRITPRHDGYTADGPGAFRLQYSDDGSAWTTRREISGLTWPSTSAQTISVASDTVYAVLSEEAGQQLQLRTQSFTAGAASYTRLLLTGSVYGATGGTGTLRTALYGLVLSEGGETPGGGGMIARLLEVNRIIEMYKKNTAGQNLPFALVDAESGAALTGATVTAYRTIDGGAQAAVTGAITEKGNGQYNLALSAADTNGNQIGYLFTATDAVPAQLTITTSADLLTDLASAVWSYTIETGWSAVESVRVILAALAGKVSGANTTAILFRNVGDSKDRISATVDQYGNRTVITYDKT